MQDPNQIQQINQNSQAVPTFFIPNVPQSVSTIQPNQQILLGQQNNFIQSVRMPISSVGQWTVNNVLTTGALTNNVNQQMQSIQGPRILFSQSGTNEHFIVQNRADMNQGSIGVNQRFIPAHSLVVTQQLPNQIKQFSVNPSQIQIPIQHQNNTAMTQLHRLNTQMKPEVIITQLPSTLSNDSNNTPINYDKNISINDPSTDPKLQNTHSFINHRRLSELVQGLDPNLQLDDDVHEVFSSFLEEFLLQATEKAWELSKLRNSNTIETKDFQYIFEHDWGIFVPGYQNCAEKPRKSVESEIHKLRMALIKKQCRR